MVTRLRSPLRRELLLAAGPYILTITESGLKLVEKGRRKGLELDWRDLLSGDAALAAALNASMQTAPPARPPHKDVVHPRPKRSPARHRIRHRP